MVSGAIRKVADTPRGKVGLGLSGFSIFPYLIRAIFEGIGIYQTMIELLPKWAPLIILMVGILLVLWTIHDMKDAEVDGTSTAQVAHSGNNSIIAQTSGNGSPIVIQTDREKNRELRDRIGDLLGEGDEILQACGKQDPHLKDWANGWANRTVEYLVGIDRSFAQRFNTARRSAMSVYGIPKGNENLWNLVHARCEELRKILSEV